MAPTGTITDLH